MVQLEWNLFSAGRPSISAPAACRRRCWLLAAKLFWVAEVEAAMWALEGKHERTKNVEIIVGAGA